MNICFATYAFDTILSKLSSQNLSSIRPVKYDGTTAQEIITTHLNETYLPIVVEFGKTVITVNELMELEKGDIIKLNARVGDEHEVRVQEKTVFLGRPGVVNKHRAIKITRKVDSN
jgi:flagellar motor switch protein FliM